VQRTGRGRALLDDALDFVEELEVHYRDVLGERRFETLKRLITELLKEIDPAGTLGRD
jgi:hypothetical protein